MQRRRTLGAIGLAMAIALVMAVVFSPAASAVSPDPNPWLQKRFLVMAHQGGEDEAPSNTMFALKSAILDRGADSLELDVNLSSDGQLMVIHDDTWTRIACTDALCPGPSDQVDRTLGGQRHDGCAAPGPGRRLLVPARHLLARLRPSWTAYPYRGMRFGDPAPPTGYSATDFEIPTLKQVLDTFPDIPINIEIKMIKTHRGHRRGMHQRQRDAVLRRPDGVGPGGRRIGQPAQPGALREPHDLIVVSFSDALLSWFHEMDGPPYVALAPGVKDTTAFALQGITPDPDVAAFQVPPDQFGIHVPEFLLNQGRAHCLGYAVHIWTNGDQDETPEAYQRFYDSGADGVMTSRPEAFTTWMEQAGITASRPARPAQPGPSSARRPPPPLPPAQPPPGAEGEEEVQEEEEGQEVGGRQKEAQVQEAQEGRRDAARRR